jgi:hypothetical protein
MNGSTSWRAFSTFKSSIVLVSKYLVIEFLMGNQFSKGLHNGPISIAAEWAISLPGVQVCHGCFYFLKPISQYLFSAFDDKIQYDAELVKMKDPTPFSPFSRFHRLVSRCIVGFHPLGVEPMPVYISLCWTKLESEFITRSGRSKCN